MKRRFYLPLIAYFIGWFYWKTVLGPWPMLIFVAAFFAWGMAIGREKRNRGPMHYLWAGVTALIGLAITMNRCGLEHTGPPCLCRSLGPQLSGG